MLDRITVEPDKMGGKPCIRGMRVPVSLVLNLVANGMTDDEIIEAYPYLEKDDIRQCLLYAAALVKDDSYHLVRSGG
jgi:uncharacterized protein (DUF433 family)